MTQPVAYNRAALYGETYFTDWTTAHPSDPHQGNKIDGELNAIAKSVSQHAFNLALLQRDDGGLHNGIVTPDSLNDDLYPGLNPVGIWASGTVYDARDGVTNTTKFYRHADTTHTAGATFVGDLPYWTEIFDFTLIGVAILSTSTPATLGGAATYGSSTLAARGDHVHAVLTAATPTALTFGNAAAVGTGTLAAREDHAHAIPAIFDASQPATLGPASTVGSSTVAARRDHVHGYDTVHAALVSVAAAANTFPYFTSATVATVGAITAAALTVLDDASTAAMLTTLAAAGQGKTAIWIPAMSMWAVTTNPATSGSLEMAATKPMFSYWSFDAATQQYVQFALRMPKSWNGSTVTAQFVWAHPATTTNFGVVWNAAGIALSDNEAANASFGTAQQVTDTGGTTSNIYISPETAAITIGSSPAAQDLVYFQVARVAADGSDTCAVAAYLLGVNLFITTNAATDA